MNYPYIPTKEEVKKFRKSLQSARIAILKAAKCQPKSITFDTAKGQVDQCLSTRSLT